MAPFTKVTCSNCGLQSTPNADALCPGCGMPVTIDVREPLPPAAPSSRLPSVEQLTQQLEAQRTRPRESLFNRQMGPKVIVGGLVTIALVRFLLRFLFHWER